MKVKKYDSQISRKVLTGMIAHDEILESLYTRLGEEREPFNQRWLDLVARWCLDYYGKYHKAPRGAIADRFARYVDKEAGGDDEGLELIERFLDSLGRDFKAIKKDLNQTYILDLALQLFSRVRLERMVEQVQDALDQNNLEKAQEVHAGFRKMDINQESFDDPFSKELILQTFKQMDQEEELVNFRRPAMRRFLGPHMKRGDFVSFVGPEKRGKSFWLQEVAYLALRSKRRVLYYSFGDMAQREVLKRLWVRAARKPWKSQEVKLPRRIIYRDGQAWRVKGPTVESDGLTKRDVWNARQGLLQVTACNEINLRLHVNAGGVVSASSIETKVHQLVHQEGWLPDVIVIDYADLLEAESETKRMDVRHQHNATWMILRRIALENHCLVVTGTQASSGSYSNRWVLTKKDFSEDKRKNAHVTGMIGINQSDKEKELGIYRLNWIVLRDGRWTESQVVWAAGNLAISAPAIISQFLEEKENE